MKIGIFGYGNLGRGVELDARLHPDLELMGVFTRRDPATVKTLTGVPVYAAKELETRAGEIDVLILCGGEHFARVDEAARGSGHTALISGGWDPGLFSLARLYMNVALPAGKDYTFWGRGVSQGHSDAIRRIPGVRDARQYTIPVEDAVRRVRAGENPELTTREKHTRECWVVAEEGADRALIEKQIREMPNYFADYDTTVHFISEEELKRDHAGLPHGGSVIRGGTTGEGDQHRHVMEFSLKLDSNPEFTASVLLACARAVGRMNRRGDCGCKTLFDVAPADLSPLSPEELRRRML